MPKFNKIQSSFNAGEVSKNVYGRVDNEKYDQALSTCLNYLPTIQGPLVRRPGTKFVAGVKDPTKPPALIPFQFSASQNYILEFGDRYVRFFTNEGVVTTSSTQFKVGGLFNASWTFYSVRDTTLPLNGFGPFGDNELITTSSVIVAGSTLELNSPYSWQDVKDIKWSQKQDVLYLAHPNYPPHKLERHGATYWTIRPVVFSEGPYLPLNSYQSLGDNPSTVLMNTNIAGIYTTSNVVINGAVSSTNNWIRLQTQTPHGFSTGQYVYVENLGGTVEANNVSNPNSSTIIACIAWKANVIDLTHLQLIDSQFTNVYAFTGNIRLALFQGVMINSSFSWADFNRALSVTRNVMFIDSAGFRVPGRINLIINAANFLFGPESHTQVLTDNSPVQYWYFGNYNLISGFPSSVCMHQDRLCFAGHPNIPQQIDMSMTGLYETFSISGSTGQVANNNALQFSLNSQDQNQIKWLKSNSQGLLAGTQSAEWAVSPNNQQGVLTPTNIKADSVSAFGSYDTDAVPVGNALLYIQRAQRRVRELLYFWQVGNFRSTNLSEMSEHITIPAVQKLVSQRETRPTVWGLRSDGQLISMGYSRDDASVKAGWARHQLGGQSDSAQSPPQVVSMAAIPSSDTSYDELWLCVKRHINGSGASCTIEYMTKSFDDNTPQEDSYHLDCGATYKPTLRVTAMTVASSCVVTAPGHAFTASSIVRFYDCVGMNIRSTDINGNITNSNAVNYRTFQIASVSSSAFKIQDFEGNDINTNSCSIYIGSAIVRKLVTQVTGLNWLIGETVSVVADGGVHVNTSVVAGGGGGASGVLNLAFPAAVVSVGYQYNSDAQMLRTKDGSAQGTAIGTMRRCNRVAFMLHHVGDLSYGSNFTKLIPLEFYRSDAFPADTAPPLFDGIKQEGLESTSGFTDTVCIRQQSGLPGMIQSITRFVEQNDV